MHAVEILKYPAERVRSGVKHAYPQDLTVHSARFVRRRPRLEQLEIT